MPSKVQQALESQVNRQPFKPIKKDRRNYPRARRAQRALRAHGTERFVAQPHDLTDLLADLRHYCDIRGWDFGNQDRIAYDHYCAERGWIR